MPSKAFKLAEAMISNPVMSDIVTNTAAVPVSITNQIEISTDQGVATVNDLPNIGNNTGDIQLVESTNRLYVWNGSGWYNIALINTTPAWDSGGQPAGSYVLDADSPQNATIISLAASDPEGLPINYTYVTSGQMDSIATISQDSSVFTITPKTAAQVPDGGTGSITFRASDGINILPQVSSFTLTFSSIVGNSNYTTLLATADGTSDNNNITDASTSNHSITVTGDAHAGTFSPYRSGGYSLYNTSTNHIQTSGLTAPATGDYTIEAWVYVTNNSANNVIWDTRLVSQDGTNGSYIIFTNSNKFTFGTGLTTYFTTTSTYNTNEWLHVALVRDGSTARLYINGVLGGSTSNSTNWNSGDINIGSNRSGASVFNGYIRDLRVANEVVYSGAFTPPTGSLTTTGGEYSDTTNVNTSLTTTQLLTCHLPYLADGSSNDRSITVTGSVETKPFGPYDYNEYSAADHGGSVYFDGTGDYIEHQGTFTLPAGTNANWTIECWVNLDQVNLNQGILRVSSTAASGNNDDIYFSEQTGYINVACKAGGINNPGGNSNYTMTANTWHHIAMVKNSGTIYLYNNGVYCGSLSDSNDYSGSYYVYGGLYYSSSYCFAGHLSDFRISNSAIYTSGTSNFTPPTAPLSSSGTSLHIKGIDASIIDKSQGSNLNLVGNTTGSATQVKFSNTKSMYFDGTGDYIVSQEPVKLGTQDFTAECWLYYESGLELMGNRTTSDSGGFSVRITSTSVTVGNSSGSGFGSVFSGTTSSLTNAWHHIAVSRSSGVTKIYVDGTSIASHSNSIDFSLSNPFVIGYAYTNGGGADSIQGYIQDFRITKGLALYTATDETSNIPSAPLKG